MMKAGDFYKSILNEIVDGVYFVDNQGSVTFWNSASEVFTGFAEDEIAGKKCSEGFLNHVDEKGRKLCGKNCPLENALKNGKKSSVDAYLHHKNGYRVPVSIKTAPVFDEHEQIMGAVEIFTGNEKYVLAKKEMKKYKKQAFTDSLTDALNRRHMTKLISCALNEKKRYGWPFSVVFFDVDNFKSVNDKYSHKAGDRVIKMVAKTIDNNIRSSDILCRWGGEEFLVLLKNASLDTAAEKAEQLRMLVGESYLFWRNKNISVTVSGGVSEAGDDDDDDSVVQRADQLMYEAKKKGRNCIVC
ncbi:MAG: diguanylate cyclase [bacterium]